MNWRINDEELITEKVGGLYLNIISLQVEKIEKTYPLLTYFKHQSGFVSHYYKSASWKNWKDLSFVDLF